MGKIGYFGVFWGSSQKGQFPGYPQNGHFAKIGVLGKMGFLAISRNRLKKGKNGHFVKRGKIGYTLKITKMTVSGKTVKKGDFLTKCQVWENSGLERIPGIFYRVKKSRSVVFGVYSCYRVGKMWENGSFWCGIL